MFDAVSLYAALQGTNAHAVIQTGDAWLHATDSYSPSCPLLWERQTLWLPGWGSLLASRAMSSDAGTSVIKLTADLSAPALAYLFDHQV